MVFLFVLFSVLFFLTSISVTATTSTTFSIGYKKLEISPPYVWYWGWDGCNCRPEDLKCGYDLYNEGKVCSEGATGSYPYGPFGGYRFTWGMGAPGGILNLLDIASKIKIGIEDYTKPLWVSGPIFTDSGGGIYVPQSQASKLYCGVIDGKEVYKWVANYSLQTTNYIRWIEELAAKIKNHPNLAAITITHGMDGESGCKDNRCNTTYPDGTQVTDPCAGFEGYKNAVTAAFYKNFCNGTYDSKTGFCNGTMKPVYFQTSPWGDAGGQLGQYLPPMGMKFSGFIPDTTGIQYGGRWKSSGLIDTFVRYRNLIPTAVEPKYGNWFLDNRAEAGGQGTYWWNLEALWLRPTAIDINPGYGLRWTTKDDPDYYELMNNHWNVTAQTSPDVWIALRDTPNVCGAKTFQQIENNICVSTYSGVSGKIGDYDFFLKRPDGIQGNKTIVLTRPDVYGNDLTIEPLRLYNQEIPQSVWQYKYSRHIRRTDKATSNYFMSFDVNNDYPWTGKPGQTFEATVYFLDIGSNPFYLDYKNSQGQLIRKTIQKNNTQIWQKVKITLDDAYFNDNMGLGDDANGEPTYTDFRIYNGGQNSENIYLHMIKIKGLGAKPTSQKIATNIICSLPNVSIIQGESPTLEANLIDSAGNALANKNISISIDPFWYTYRISHAQTDSLGIARKNLDLSTLPAFFQESRSAHEVEVVFPGDANYLSSSAICYFPYNLKRADFIKKTIIASLSKNIVKVGDEVTVTVNSVGGGNFSVEGEGFGLPACTGTVGTNGIGSCTFKVGGMAIAGRRIIGVNVAWSSPYAAAATNIPITVLDESSPITPPPPPPPPPPSGSDPYSQILATAYSSQSGTQNSTCSDGSSYVGYIENGDYLVFNNLDFGTSGAASFQARMASQTSGGTIDIRLDSPTGTQLGTCAVGTTNDWCGWTTVSCNVSAYAGTHNLYLKFIGSAGYLFNLNWFKFIQKTADTIAPAIPANVRIQ